MITAAVEERVILFKNPSGGPQYAQALLNVFCAPTNSTVKLTTYSSLWVPQTIFENPSSLQGQKAILVCADAEKDASGTWWLKKLYPIREVTISDYKIEGKFLTLWVQALGYVRCTDYDKYTHDTKEAFSNQGLPLPPAQNSYIALDRIRDFEVVSIDNETAMQTEWQNIGETLASLKVFDKVAFYNVTQIEDVTSKENVGHHKRLENVWKKLTREKDSKKSNLMSKTGQPFAYQLTENKKYEITLTHLLPFHNQEGKQGRLDLEVVMPKNIDRDSDEAVDIAGRQASQTIAIIVESVSKAKYTHIKIQPKEPTFSNAPVISIPLSINPASFWIRYWRRVALIIPIIALGFFYAYAQLIEGTKSYPALETLFSGSAEAWGATLSAVLLILIPLLISQMLKGKSKD